MATTTKSRPKAPTTRSRTRTRSLADARAVRAIVWNGPGLRPKGGTVLFIQGKGRQSQRFEKVGPVKGDGLTFERNLAKALGIEQDRLYAYLQGREVYGVSVHPLMVSTERDRRASAQARRG